MKNLLLASTILLLLGTQACKKEYNCDCSWTDPITLETETMTHVYGEQKEEDATSGCAEQELAYQVNDADAACVVKEL